MRSLPASCVIACCALLSCTPPQGSVTPQAATVAPVNAVPAQNLAPDMSPVAEPANLVGVGRLRDARATFEAAMRMANLQGVTLEGLFAHAGKPDRLALFKLDASVDLALALDPRSSDDDPKFFAAVSVPVRDLEETRAAISSNFLPVAPGVYRGILLELGQPGEKASHCDLSMALGDAPARLVCADSDRELDELRPWLVRGLPLVKAPEADVRLDIKARALQQHFGPTVQRELEQSASEADQWLRTALNVTEPELLAAPGELLRQGYAFVSEVDSLSFEGSLQPASQQLAMRGTLSFRSANSWFTRALTHRGDRTAPPPPIFWRVPRESETAVFHRGQDRALYEPSRRVLRLAFGTLLTQAGSQTATRAAVDDFLGSIPEVDVVSVSAVGPAAARAARKPGKQRRPAEAVEDFRYFVQDYVGWWMTGIEAPSGPYVAWLKKGATALQAVTDEARKQLTQGAQQTWLPGVKLVPSPAGFPKNSVALDVPWQYDSKLAWSILPEYSDQEHPDGAVARGTITLRLVVVPDGADRTWLAVSADPGLLRARISAVLQGAKSSGTITDRADLQQLRSVQAASAGFASRWQSLDKSMRLAGALSGKLDPALEAVLAVPNGWKTPVLLVGKGTTGNAPSTTVEVLVQPGTIEDFISLVRSSLMGALTAELSGPAGLRDRSRGPVLSPPIIPVPPAPGP